MMDASVSLMNQYMMIVNRMPAAPLPATPSTSSDSQSTADVPIENSEQPTEPVTQNDDSEAGPSSSPTAKSIETLEIDGDTVIIEDVEPNDISDTNDIQSELRRRRLQRFEVKSEDS